MADREKYDYSIITYSPNKIRSERINVGVLFSDINGSDVFLRVIKEHSSKKLRSLVQNRYDQKLYDSSISYLEYCVKKINENDLSLSTESVPIKSVFDLQKKGEFPNELLLSAIRTVTTANFEMILSKIIDTYIGNEFFNAANANTLDLKRSLFEDFKAKRLINTKIKHSFPIQPDKNVDWKINVDFAFSQGKKLNILQTVPATESALDVWYPKIRTFTYDFGTESEPIYVLSDSSQPINHDNKVSQMINSIASNKRVQSIDVSDSPNKLTELINFIQDKADPISELDKLLKLNSIA